MINEPVHLLKQLKIGLLTLLILGVIGEIVLFPSVNSLYGCLMAGISYLVFSFFLSQKYFQYFPFAFCMYLSMFMYRYLPLIATLLEGKPITYGFERPLQTFIYEIILFLVSSLAFYLACKKSSLNSNNFFQNVLAKFHFFEITPSILWGMGIVGLLIRLYVFSLGEIEYGDVTGKFLIALDYLMYAPLCLIFPGLLKIKYSNQKLVLVYGVIIFILNIASNSRRQIIIPIALIAILFFIYLVINNYKIGDYLSPLKIIIFGGSLFFLINLLSDISLAMLYTRKFRDDIGKTELFEKTIEVMQNEPLMSRLKSSAAKNEINDLTSYHEGWTEHYLSNFMLARYANIRITDETLYYAEKKGYQNPYMKNMFIDDLLSLIPTPFLNFFGIYLDKSKLEFSRGDLLYGSGYGAYRVTSHVADGLVTFGHWYFPIQFVVYFIIFRLLNFFVFYTSSGVIYAPYALMNVFTFLGMFRNGQGLIADMGFIIRGFLQGVLTYMIIYHCIRLILSPSRHHQEKLQ